MLPCGKENGQHEERRDGHRFRELALPRLVDLADDRIVPNVFLDDVLERFHTASDRTPKGSVARGQPWPTRSAARSFALRARGLRSTSSARGTSGFFVSTFTPAPRCSSRRSV